MAGDPVTVPGLRSEFYNQLDAIRTDVVRLAAMVTECISRGTDVLLSGDLAGAQQLIDDDDELDVLSLQIEERCYQVLTLEGCGHWWMWERPAEAADALVAFWNR